MSRLPYFSPPDSNTYLQSRTVTDPETSAPAEIQQIEDLGTQERLTTLRTELAGLLTSIRNNTDTLEVNTDELESRVTAVRDAVTLFHDHFDARDIASVASITNLRDSLSTLLTAIRDNTDTLELNTDTLEARVQAVETAVTTFHNHFDARDMATEATLATRATEDTAAGIRAEVTKETTLVALRDRIGAVTDPATADTVIGILKRISDEDFATEATLAGLRTDAAKEATLEAIRVLLAGEDFSSETTLAALHAAVAKEATLAAMRAVNETIRDTIYRRTDALPAGTNNIGFTSPATSQKVGQGRFNLAGTGRFTLNIAGNLRLTFTNPAGSGKTISIVRLAGFSTATGWGQIILNPTVGVPASSARPFLNAVAGGGVPAVAQIRADTNATIALSGGVDTGIVLGLPGGARTSLDLPPIVLAPGVTFGVNIPFTGAADAAMSVYWIED